MARALTAPAMRRLDRATADPVAARDATWTTIRAEIGGAPYWQRRGGLAASVEDHPITTYDDYRAAIAESFHSGASLLSTKPVVFFAETGGTTSPAPKLFPLTACYRKSIRSIGRCFLHSLSQRIADLQLRPLLTFAEASSRRRSPGGHVVGYVSHFLHRPQQLADRLMGGLPPALYRDAETLAAWAPLYALSCDFGYISAVNAAKIRVFAEAMLAGIDGWWAYLEGRTQPPRGLPRLRIPRSRLRILRRAFGRGSPTFDRIWPRLRFVGCWKSGVSGLQLPALRPYLGNVPVIDGPFGATEAWLTVPLWNDRNGGVLHPDTALVEFLPEGAPADPERLLASWELITGARYELILTTRMGLVRYRIHDVVTCTGYYNRAPILVFSHKGDFVLRIGQVNIAEGDAAACLDRAGLTLADHWCLGPQPTGDGLRFYVRSAGDPEDDQLGAATVRDLTCCLDRLDAALADHFPQYRLFRSTGLLRRPDVGRLAHSHEIWNRPRHAQSKPRLLLTTVVAQEDLER